MILNALATILNCENEVLKFERDPATQGAEFEDLHPKSKPSSERLNLIFSHPFSGVIYSFIALDSCYLFLNMRG
jgi:hypothetical protein